MSGLSPATRQRLRLGSRLIHTGKLPEGKMNARRVGCFEGRSWSPSLPSGQNDGSALIRAGLAPPLFLGEVI